MIKKILKFTSLSIFLLLTFFASAQPKGTVVEGVTAVVGRNIILKSEVDQQYDAYRRQMTGADNLTRCEVMEELLFQKLLVHHAEIDSVIVSQDEVESNMDRRIQQLVGQMGGDPRKLEEYYNKSILEIKEEMRPLMKEQLTAQRMQGGITDKVEVTPTEVQEFYKKIPQDSLPLINTEVEVAQIVRFPIVSKEAETEVIEKLMNLKERIANGSSFSSMAILYSEDPGSNKNGGEYKSIKRGQFVKEFEAVAFNLQKYEVSDPVKTIYGFHIIQLLDKRGEELDLRHILIKPKLDQPDLEVARVFLDSLRGAIELGTITWDEASSKFSDDIQTKFNGGVMSNFETGDAKFELSEIDRSIYSAIKDLNPGQVSTPTFYRNQEQKEAFRLIKLVKRVEPHKANLKEDYQRLQGLALQQKQADKIQSWIESKIGDTYIKVNTNYFIDCTINERWLVNKTSTGL